jgi:putative DNA methylase
MSTEGGEALPPFTYLWTRTILCPHCSATVPLVRQTWLRKKTGKYAALRVIPDDTAKSVRFEVVQARTIGELGFDPGTINPRHALVCLHCRTAIPLEYVETQGQNGNIGQQLMAVVCTPATSSGKWYLAGSDMPYGPDHNELVARVDALCDEYELSVPGEHVPQHLIGASRSGLTRFKDFFTLRQLVALLTWTIEVRHAYHAMLDQGMEPKRAAAITTYLGVMINHLADRNSSLCRWDPVRETSRPTYTHVVLPMVWDFTEINPFTEGYGSPTNTLNWMTSLIQELVHSGRSASIKRASAQQLPFPDHFFDAIITDPPYYHAVPYADLSDFFYVWLKRSIGFLYPDELRAWLTPKEQEAVMTDPRRDQNENVPKQDYERMIIQAFVEAHRVLKPGAPLVCIHPDTALPTLKHALEHAGFDITYTWRLDAEKTDDPVAHRMGTNPSIILVARQRERK